MIVIDNIPDWEGALCRETDPELFFPENGTKFQQIKQAKEVCKECPLIRVCLAYALQGKFDGIWGGTTLAERTVLRKKLNLPSNKK